MILITQKGKKDFKIKINRDRIVAVSKKYRYKFLGKIESKNDNIVITGLSSALLRLILITQKGKII